MPDREQGRDDRTHPRIPEAPQREGPCLVVDLDVVRENYCASPRSLPDSKVFYAVKANPAPDILRLLTELGACFDVASVPRPRWCSPPARRPIASPTATRSRRRREIARRLCARRDAVRGRLRGRGREGRPRRARPRVICRIHCDGSGSEWPLSRKFGCEPEYADRHAGAGASAAASCRTGSRSTSAPSSTMWKPGTARSASTAAIFRACAERGITLAMVNLGGGFPARYLRKTPRLRNPTARRSSVRCAAISATTMPETIIEPGRGLVGNAGIIEAEVVLVAKRSPEDETALGLSRHRQVPWARRDDRGIDPLSDPHPQGPRRDGAMHHRRADLRLGGRAVREDPLPAAGVARDRRQGADRGGRRLYGDLFVRWGSTAIRRCAST